MSRIADTLKYRAVRVVVFDMAGDSPNALFYIVMMVIIILIILNLPFVFQCSDGTRRFQCSNKSGLWCSMSGLIESPEYCGPVVGSSIPAVSKRSCADGTPHGKCSEVQHRYRCNDGTLVEDISKCGCGPGYYFLVNNTCKEFVCQDGTKYGYCSTLQPYQCQDGKLVANPGICGCPRNQDNIGGVCRSLTPIKRYFYFSRAQVKTQNVQSMTFTMYAEVYDYLRNQPRTISYYPHNESPPGPKEFIMRRLNDPVQDKYLKGFVRRIQQYYPDPDQAAHVALMITQFIPYDNRAAFYNDVRGRYPYEVLFDNQGVCGEKSELIAYCLRELNFSVAILLFLNESHEAVGIKYPGCSYKNTGWCFVEATDRLRVGYTPGTYVGVGALRSDPLIIVVHKGQSFRYM